MPEQTEVADTPEVRSDLNPPPDTGFNSMKEKLEKLMSEVRSKPETKPLDTTPVDQPELKKIEKKEKQEPAKTEAPKDEPAKADAPKEKEDKAFVSPSRENFKKLEQDRDTWKKKAESISVMEKELADLRQKLSETQGIKPEEVESLKKERQALNDRLEQVALERSDKFHSYYQNKFDSAMEAAVDAVGKERSEQIKAVMEAPKSAWRKDILNELISGMEKEVDKLSLLAAVTKYDEARSERERELGNWKANLQKLREHEESKAREENERGLNRRKGILSEVLKVAESSFPSFQEKEGDADHNAHVTKSRKLVEEFIMGTATDDMVKMLPAMAAEGERLMLLLPKLEAQLKEKDEALAVLKNAAPKPGEQKQSEKEEPMGFKERVLANWPNPK